MKRQVIEKMLKFLKEKEGHELPEAWVDLMKKLELVRELEAHPYGTQYRHEGYLDLYETNITKLPDDLYVGGWLDLTGCKQLKKLPNDLYVGDGLSLSETNISELPSKLYIGSDLFLYNTPLADKYTDDQIIDIVASTGGKIEGQIIRE